jgi:hypothetical protein
MMQSGDDFFFLAVMRSRKRTHAQTLTSIWRQIMLIAGGNKQILKIAR